jgi:hypothetical protein
MDDEPETDKKPSKVESGEIRLEKTASKYG